MRGAALVLFFSLLVACGRAPRTAALARANTKTGGPLASVTAMVSQLDVLSAPAVVQAIIAKHVIIVSEDGMRPDLLTLSIAPTHHRLMAQGAYSLQAMTVRRASTLPSHAAMLSGFDTPEHGLYWNSWRPERGFIKVPTVFEAATESGKGAAAFVGKQKLAHVIKPGMVDVFATPSYLCRKVVETATAYFLEHQPQVEFIHFSDPDSFGHKDGWMSDGQRNKGVKSSDRCLATLIDAIAGSPLAADTLVIVSADHGGHGHNHSGSCLEDRLIPWFAWGAGVRVGHQIEGAISTVDTAATTLWALGLAAPAGQKGRPVKEAFR